MAASPTGHLLEISDLQVEFPTPEGGALRAVAGAGYSVRAGETLAVVGESGSGKTVTAQAVMGLLDPPARIVGGSIRFRDLDLLTLDERERRRLRGSKLALVPQDALAALDPLMPVGDQIAEMFVVHRETDLDEARREAVRLMERVGIPDAERRARDLPHRFSGGMRQRIVIAIAVSLSPELVIADEATSALDVTVQLQVVRMLNELKDELAMSVVFITHDLLAARDIADRVVVMYAGRTVEEGPVEEVFAAPTHPYTEALLLSTPRLGGGTSELRPIPGRPPGRERPATGCVFEPRCAYRRSVCVEQVPPLREVRPGGSSACHFAPDYHHPPEEEAR